MPRNKVEGIPVFWACGVTPQAAIEIAKPEIVITHAPGHMFITIYSMKSWSRDCSHKHTIKLIYYKRYGQKY